MEMNMSERLALQIGMAEVFKAMGHPTRLQILCLLRGGEICVCHLERIVDRRQAYVSQQLTVLREAGLVATRRDGLQIYYRLAHPQIEPILTSAGAPPPALPSRIEGCPCRLCTTISIAEIR
jgi:DNA-binding transcriptional ArsR family regulator